MPDGYVFAFSYYINYRAEIGADGTVVENDRYDDNNPSFAQIQVLSGSSETEPATMAISWQDATNIVVLSDIASMC